MKQCYSLQSISPASPQSFHLLPQQVVKQKTRSKTKKQKHQRPNVPHLTFLSFSSTASCSSPQNDPRGTHATSLPTKITEIILTNSLIIVKHQYTGLHSQFIKPDQNANVCLYMEVNVALMSPRAPTQIWNKGIFKWLKQVLWKNGKHDGSKIISCLGLILLILRNKALVSPSCMLVLPCVDRRFKYRSTYSTFYFVQTHTTGQTVQNNLIFPGYEIELKF